MSDNAPQFTLEDIFYQNQLQFDLAVNIYKHGLWGCYVPFKTKPLVDVLSAHVYLTVNYVNHEKRIYWTKGEMDIDKIRK